MVAVKGQAEEICEGIHRRHMEEYPEKKCPECGVVSDDLDGFGVLICEFCGYCTHPAISGGVCDGCGKEICGGCGAEVTGTGYKEFGCWVCGYEEGNLAHAEAAHNLLPR